MKAFCVYQQSAIQFPEIHPWHTLGDIAMCTEEATTARQNLRKAMDDEKVKGFANVLVAKDVGQGIVHL